MANPGGDNPTRGVSSNGNDRAGAVTGRQLADQLSDEDRAKLRLAVQEVWNANEVRQAREELQRATQAFRASLKQAIDEQDDPELKRVMTRLLAERYAQETRASRPALRPSAALASPAAASASQSSPSKPLKKRVSPLNDREQAILERARAAAAHEPEVLAALRAREVAVDHRSKMVAAGNYRKAMRAAMLRVEPAMEQVFRKLERAARVD